MSIEGNLIQFTLKGGAELMVHSTQDKKELREVFDFVSKSIADLEFREETGILDLCQIIRDRNKEIPF